MRSSGDSGVPRWQGPRAKSWTCRLSSTAKAADSSWLLGLVYYAEKLRQEKYSLDDAALRPYFRLENVRQGIFTLCQKLYGLTFHELRGVPVYNPEVQVFEVRESDGRVVGVLYMDFHPRPGKRGGAWSGAFRRQYYSKGRESPPCRPSSAISLARRRTPPSLLSVEEVETFFHEFGHSLATLLSDGAYRDRSVPRDAIELPSQIMENWVLGAGAPCHLCKALPERRRHSKGTC